jgi:hypothetical protein
MVIRRNRAQSMVIERNRAQSPQMHTSSEVSISQSMVIRRNRAQSSAITPDAHEL